MSAKNTKPKEKYSHDINDLFSNLSLKDASDNNFEKSEQPGIKVKKNKHHVGKQKNNSAEDSGYEDDKLDLKFSEDNDEIVPKKSMPKMPVEHEEDGEDSNDEANIKSNIKISEILQKSSKAANSTVKKNLVTGHQDLIISGDKDDSVKEPEEKTGLLGAAPKNKKDAGFIRRTGRTSDATVHGDQYVQDPLYLQSTYDKSFTLDDIVGVRNDSFNQNDVKSPQIFAPFLLSSDSNSMNIFATQQSNQACFSDCRNQGVFFDSPQSSPSPYYQNESVQQEFRNIYYPDSECDINSCAANSYLTPPPSVSPPKQFLDGSSPCHQSCIQIVDLIDKVDQNTLGGSAPEDELKNLLSALDCEQDSSLWGMGSFRNENLNKQQQVRMNATPFNKVNQYQSENNDPVSNMWKDIQETDSSELSVYLPTNLNVDEAERAVLSHCDPQTLFDLESRVSTVLSNNPMAIIPEDPHGDTNLIVLASRENDKRDKIIEKIYALAKGLSTVRVCCKSPVENFQCISCGNSNPESFHTPLTLCNVQGYTALSCAVLRGYPTLIVKYLVALIQRNKMDLAREFNGDRNKLYLAATEYPYLSRYAAEYTPLNW